VWIVAARARGHDHPMVPVGTIRPDAGNPHAVACGASARAAAQVSSEARSSIRSPSAHVPSGMRW